VRKAEQPIAFNTLSRVAYYGLSFDGNGTLRHANNAGEYSAVLDDNADSAMQFIREANNHLTKVDWVVSKSDWNVTWADETTERKQVILAHLAENISLFLKTPIRRTWMSLLSKLTYGNKNALTRGEGVTLYFKNYPIDTVSTRLFGEFVTLLEAKLQKDNGDFFVNILMSQSDLNRNEGIYSYQSFLGLLEHSGIPPRKQGWSDTQYFSHLHSYLLVFVDEPSTENKKLLRSNLDHILHGDERKLILHSLVPVLLFDRQNWLQFKDDISYVNTAFYGIGLWPMRPEQLPADKGTCADGGSISKCVKEQFTRDNSAQSSPLALEGFVCLHRFGLRIALSASLFLMFLIGVLIFLMQGRSPRMEEATPYLFIGGLLLPFLIFTLLLFFDPVLIPLSRGNIPFISVVILLILGAGGLMLYLRSKTEQPSREALRAFMNNRLGK
jgi:hypothetical protein